MKTFKNYLFILTALVGMLSFSSCDEDEDIGFSLSGYYGITWFGDMGASDYDGWPLDSYITFQSGSYPDHGVGIEELYYQDPPYEYYDTYKFDWEIVNGRLYIDYDTGEHIVVQQPYISRDRFSGRIGNFSFELYYEGGRSAKSQK